VPSMMCCGISGQRVMSSVACPAESRFANPFFLPLKSER
jgi:hypothetical protein